MQRGRLGGIPLPRTFPIRGGGIGSMMVVRYSRLPGRARTVWRRSVLLLREGAPHPPQRRRVPGGWPVLKKSMAPRQAW